jgi:hypothetical protein
MAPQPFPELCCDERMFRGSARRFAPMNALRQLKPTVCQLKQAEPIPGRGRPFRQLQHIKAVYDVFVFLGHGTTPARNPPARSDR